MAKKGKAPTLVSKETMAAEVQNVPYVSRAEEIQQRIAARNKIIADLNKPKRARTKKGQLKGDDLSTPKVNEAWEGGKAPKKKKKKK
jgi:hypothetical protein